MATAESVLKPDHQSKRKHFIFTDEHEQLRESIRSFVTKELTPHAEEWEETTFPDSVFRRMGELDLLGLDKPEAYGGQGGDYFTSLVLGEEMTGANSGGLAMGVAVHTDMAMPPILAFGSEEQKQEWVVPAIKGEKILCIGITEPDAGSDVAGIKTRAVKDGDEYVINGSKTYITNGHRADVIVLVTKTDPDAGYGGFTLFLVPMDAPGVIREKKLEKLGMHAQDTSELFFDDVFVPAANLIGETPGVGFGQLMNQLAWERMIIAIDATVNMERAVRLATDYVRERKIFGKPLMSFQNTEFVLADAKTEAVVARTLVDALMVRLLAGDLDGPTAAMAKLWTTETQCKVIDACQQLFGGYGYMAEYPIAQLYADARVSRIYGGASEVMKLIIARTL